MAKLGLKQHTPKTGKDYSGLLRAADRRWLYTSICAVALVFTVGMAAYGIEYGRCHKTEN